MTEIAWLVKFMFDHKLPVKAKDDIVARIGEVESQLSRTSSPRVAAMMPVYGGLVSQAPSMQRAIEEMNITPPEAIAQTAATAQALANRQAAIAAAGKTEPGRTSPRKF